MTKRYTADDFANAKFAEHPGGRRAVRTSTPVTPWIMEMRNGPGHCARDSEMAREGWVPVPTKPTITESQYKLALDEDRDPQYVYGFADAMRLFGGEVIPDPEPTNTDKLEELIISAPGNFEGVETVLKRPANVRAWAEYLNEHGVTAPNVKGN